MPEEPRDETFWTVSACLDRSGALVILLLGSAASYAGSVYMGKTPESALYLIRGMLCVLAWLIGNSVGWLILAGRVARGEKLRRGVPGDFTEASVFVSACESAAAGIGLAALVWHWSSGFWTRFPTIGLTLAVVFTPIALIANLYVIRRQWRRAKTASAHATTKATAPTASADVIAGAPIATAPRDDSANSVTVGRR